MSQETYSFSLVFHRLAPDYERLEEAFFEAGCNDALLGMEAGIVYLDFDREAPSFEEAVSSATLDVESAGIEARVAFVEPGDGVTAAELAWKLGP